MKSVAVILSGCGVYDGSEIHESVLTMLSLSRLGAEVSFFRQIRCNIMLLIILTGRRNKKAAI